GEAAGRRHGRVGNGNRGAARDGAAADVVDLHAERVGALLGVGVAGPHGEVAAAVVHDGAGAGGPVPPGDGGGEVTGDALHAVGRLRVVERGGGVGPGGVFFGRAGGGVEDQAVGGLVNFGDALLRGGPGVVVFLLRGVAGERAVLGVARVADLAAGVGVEPAV